MLPAERLPQLIVEGHLGQQAEQPVSGGCGDDEAWDDHRASVTAAGMAVRIAGWPRARTPSSEDASTSMAGGHAAAAGAREADAVRRCSADSSSARAKRVVCSSSQDERTGRAETTSTRPTELWLCRRRARLEEPIDRRGWQRLNRGVRLYALVASDSAFAVDVFVSRASADEALADVLADEPAFADLLEIVVVDDDNDGPSPS